MRTVLASSMLSAMVRRQVVGAATDPTREQHHLRPAAFYAHVIMKRFMKPGDQTSFFFQPFQTAFDFPEKNQFVMSFGTNLSY